MFRSVLVANRGEIACRVMATARRMGLRTIAVYSEADRNALHVRVADEAWPIGPAPARDSYLSIPALVAAIRASGAEAVHPGYGFLSENADFAEAVAAAGAVFVGPPPGAIRAMGSKSAAKALMEAAGVPVVPGYHGSDQSLAVIAAAAEDIGYPILVKASAGGGGRGMRVVERPDDLAVAIEGAAREAASAFGDGRLLIEKYLTRPRHIEMQVFADGHGAAIHLFERDCSIQRRHQKVIEEAPAPGMTAERRQAMGAAATAAARAIGYRGAGTVEFIAEGEQFWFMEMNTRLQVEHPVTEMITGLDLVEWQLRVAAGEPLPLGQADLAIHGHAVEARLYAEDPAHDFRPATGRLAHLRLPVAGEGVRVDAGVAAGDAVSVHYDAMIAKIVAHGRDRGEAIRRLGAALAATEIAGVTTNRDFLVRLVGHPAFAAAELDTGFIARHAGDLLPASDPPAREEVAAAVLHVLLSEQAAAAADPSPWAMRDGWRIGERARRRILLQDGDERVAVDVVYREDGWRLEIGGQGGEATATRGLDGRLAITLDGRRLSRSVVATGDQLHVFGPAGSRRFVVIDPLAPPAAAEAGTGRLTAPMPGRVTRLLVAAGDAVARGQALLVLEAMKMEHTIRAPADGVVGRLRYGEGDLVDEGAELVELAAPDSATDASNGGGAC
ncbi:3-methylcrotonyl-CoA carboxylase alpha subunit [Stella humosa]|uniref:3-methylcrotonyl-CoA carboxylase alpha subunit n=1 Tax=Stella humosa TaxID=94 RepID=A0A3N1KWS3_9PROT|nr:acetyl-CoA carboxylase biotin carboxylase subunit [Stella humosa]ROP83922.1 3-methylcrotonyl-CoA carboxylase alpha subunit [Stella humosa]